MSKYKTLKETGRVKTKNFFSHTILDKIFGTKSRNPVKLDRSRKV